MVNIKVSMNYNITGKPIKGPDGKYTCGDKKVNLGWGWRNTVEPYNAIFAKLTENGHAIAPYLKPEAKGHRDENKLHYFQSHSLALVDIDAGMKIEDLANDELYQDYGGGFYVTPSHTPEHHKFRIIFCLEKDVEDANDMRHLYNALIKEYRGDPNCKDAARLFYGTINASRKEITDKVLPDDIVRALIKEQRDAELERFKNMPADVEYNPPTDDEKKHILELLQRTFIGSYPIWRDIGWGLREGGFSLEDFQFVTTCMMNKKSAHDAKKIWDGWTSNASTKVTMGTVIHILKERHGLDWQRTTQTSLKKVKLKQRQVEIQAELAELTKQVEQLNG